VFVLFPPTDEKGIYYFKAQVVVVYRDSGGEQGWGGGGILC